MALEFQPPPQGLIDAYLNRPSGVQLADQNVHDLMAAYVQNQHEKSKGQTEAIGTLAKLADNVDFSDPNTIKAFGGLFKQAGIKSDVFNPSTPPTPSTGTVSSPQMAPATPTPLEQSQAQSLPAEHPVLPGVSTASPLIQASLNHPDHQAAFGISGINPEQLVKTSGGRKKLAAAESVQKFYDAQQTATDKATENAPKSFDYANAFAKAAGSPDAAKPFIDIAKQEGRTTLNRRELDDMKNAVNVSAQSQRGQYFGTSAEVKMQTMRDNLIKEARTSLDPYFQTGQGKQQAERLNRIGRADALIQQMQTQVGGGDTRQMRELGTSLASVLTGGNVVAQNQVEELIPQTYKGRFNVFLEKLSNNPTGTEQQAFIKRFADTLAREKTTIQGQARTVAERTAPTLRVLKSQFPEDYHAVVDQYLTNSPEIMGPSQTSQTPSGTPMKIGRFTVEAQ